MSTADTFQQDIEAAKARREAERVRRDCPRDKQADALAAYLKLCDDRREGRTVDADAVLDAANEVGTTIDEFTRDVEARASARMPCGSMKRSLTSSCRGQKKSCAVKKRGEREMEQKRELIRLDQEISDLRSAERLQQGRLASFESSMKASAPAYVRRLRDKIETDYRRLRYQPTDPLENAATEAQKKPLHDQIQRDELLLESLETALQNSDYRLLPPAKKGT